MRVSKTNYKKSGVDVKKADLLASWIKASHFKKNLDGDYASLWPFPKTYKDPVLATCTDGVGTKLALASYFKDFSHIGQDLLAMCLNDLLCVGAKPLFFLDYYATGKLEEKDFKSFLTGLKKACKKASVELVGGETAEMPGMYKKGDVDVAGFLTGVVERSLILKPLNVQEGDLILGIKSSGFHSNGYSLLRKIYKTKALMDKNKKELLKPTRLYHFLTPHLKSIKAMAHITGGGLNNLSRILPSHLQANLKPWKVPAPFLDVKKRSGMSWKEMLEVFNCGIGMIVIVKNKESLKLKEKVIELGKIVKRKDKKHVVLDFKGFDKKS